MEGDGNYKKIGHNLNSSTRTTDVRLKETLPFEKMMLSKCVKKGLQKAGFIFPTIIQAAAIPLGKAGLDLLIQSKSGTGKTLIFSIIILETYEQKIHFPQALVLAPTRELAKQTQTVLNTIGEYCSGFCAVTVIGGLDIANDRQLMPSAKAVCGTLGRVLRLIENKALNTAHIKLLVIDEADRMYGPNFRTRFQKIKDHLPSDCQVIGCSATFNDNIDQELAKVMHKPLLISIDNNATLLVGIKQFVYELREEKSSILKMQAKLNGVKKILSCLSFRQCLIFVGSQSRASSYCNYLEKDGWPCDLISGADNQKDRIAKFEKLVNFQTRLIVTTDLLARGIDLENVNLVINLDLPDDVATYLHRVGRAGRFGSHGISITFLASGKDQKMFKRFMSQLSNEMKVLKFPKDIKSDSKENFWNFNDFDGECERFGLFDGSPVPPSSREQSLFNESNDNKENVLSNANEAAFSIDTKTFHVNINANIPEVADNCVENAGSSQHLPSSNTIDDASSIAVDSLRSSQQDVSIGHSANLLTLVDVTKNKSLDLTEVEVFHENKKDTEVDIFDDFENFMAANDTKIKPEAQQDTLENCLEFNADSATENVEGNRGDEEPEVECQQRDCAPKKEENMVAEPLESSSTCLDKLMLLMVLESSGTQNYVNKIDIFEDFMNFDCASSFVNGEKSDTESVIAPVQIEVCPAEICEATEEPLDLSVTNKSNSLLMVEPDEDQGTRSGSKLEEQKTFSADMPPTADLQTLSPITTPLKLDEIEIIKEDSILNSEGDSEEHKTMSHLPQEDTLELPSEAKHFPSPAYSPVKHNNFTDALGAACLKKFKIHTCEPISIHPSPPNSSMTSSTDVERVNQGTSMDVEISIASSSTELGLGDVSVTTTANNESSLSGIETESIYATEDQSSVGDSDSELMGSIKSSQVELYQADLVCWDSIYRQQVMQIQAYVKYSNMK